MPDDQLDAAVLALLESCPDVWRELNIDALTAIEQSALFLLTAAALVERLFRIRLQMVGQATAVEATISASGEYGIVEAYQSMAATLQHEWYAAFVAYRDEEHGDARPFLCEKVGAEEWHLTRDGVKAIGDLRKGNQHVVLDYVLRRGPLAGRPSIAGEGQLVQMKKVEPDPMPGSVKLTNWAEGAQAFAEVFYALISQRTDNAVQTEQPRHGSGGSDTGKKHGTNPPPLRSWTQTDLDGAIRKYKADRAQAYNDLVRAVTEGRRGSKPAARKLFGRNTIAKALGVKAQAMVSKSRAWQVIAAELELSGDRGPKGTHRTRKPGKVGLDAALDRVSNKGSRGMTPAELEAEADRLIEEAEQREADPGAGSDDSSFDSENDQA